MNEWNERIDRYLQNELSVEERIRFEQELDTNPEFRKSYEQHQYLMEASQRLGIKGRLRESMRRIRRFRILRSVVLGTVIAAVIAAGIVYAARHGFAESSQEIHYNTNEQGLSNWSEADAVLPSQFFYVQADRDTVLETEEGILFSIPKNAFVNPSGQPAKGEIELEVKEAMTAADILRAGLSTTSDGRLLETGGMFYINARQGGQNLSIHQDHPLQVNVPTPAQSKPMLLFDGLRQPDGRINWVNPQKLRKELTTLDMSDLNFYPPHYLDSIAGMGYDAGNKHFTDSVYYHSVPCAVSPAQPRARGGTWKAYLNGKFNNGDSIPAGNMQITSMDVFRHRTKTETANEQKVQGSQLKSCVSDCPSIDPSVVHAFWDRQFNGTLLATREFEERMQWIHTTCECSVLGVYLENMDKDLSFLDSMAWATYRQDDDIKTKFYEFYKRGDGGVSLRKGHLKKLNTYLAQKAKHYEEARSAVLLKLYKENAAHWKAADAKRVAYWAEETQRSSKVFEEEVKANMKEIYRQLDLPLPKTGAVSNYNSAPLSSLGWKNVDRYVEIPPITFRGNITVKDSLRNKHASIVYQPVQVKLADSAKYDRIMAYLLPDRLNSFQRMATSSSGQFSEQMNAQFQYALVVVAFKGDDVFYFEERQALSKTYDVQLKAIDSEDWTSRVNAIRSFKGTPDLVKDIGFLHFEAKEDQRLQRIAEQKEFERRIHRVIYPCRYSVWTVVDELDANYDH